MGRKKGKGPAKSKVKPSPRQQRPARPSKAQRPARAADDFSMADEARWASHHRSRAFDADKQLRHLKVDFVSAGYLEGTIDKMPPQPESPTNADAMAQMTIRSPSPSPSASSDSSQDEVVFQGRSSAPSSGTPAVQPEAETPEGATPSRTAAVSGECAPSSMRATPSAPRAMTPAQGPSLVPADSDAEGVAEHVSAKRLGGQSPWMCNTTPWESRSKPGIGWLPVQDRPEMASFINRMADPAAAAMNDYMENVREDVEADADLAPSFARRDMGLGEEVLKRDDSRNSDLLQDFNKSSTSSDVTGTIERVIATRTRNTEVQFLVVYEGSASDDAHWLPASFLTSTKDLELVRLFEARNTSRGRHPGSDSDSDSESSSLPDEDDAEEKAGVCDDDERLARALQIQENFGLGSDEAVLFGSGETFDTPDSALTSDPERFDRPWKKRQARSRGAEPSFPPASVMADALDMDPYGGFDVMDTERPSLRPRKKGRRGQMPPELSDSDLNEQLQSAWEADRQKKRLKKAEREELRKQGLLSRKGKAPDLSVKYKDGINMDEIVEEIRDFLFSDLQTLSLPPMESHRRSVVHQMANQLGINSKSRGSGANRFTVLTKTTRTKNVDDGLFDAFIHKKRFKARFEAAPRVPGKPKPTRPVVSYRDGETVGATAPELGPENRGHAMLSKMGWSKGMALGAANNKGILQPIVHTVKTNKAGLQ